MVWAIVAAVVAVVSAGVSYTQAKRAQEEAEKSQRDAQAILVNREGTTEQIPVVYGIRRTGGVRVFANTRNVSGERQNETLDVVLVLAEGEVESITELHVAGAPLIGSKYSSFTTWRAYTGTDSQTADTTLIADSGGNWTSEHKLSGFAYVVVTMRMPDDAEKNPWGGGIPEITALVKGRKIYDPRDGGTRWSDNPALCLRDYLTNERFGKGLPGSAINDNLFIAAANHLDQTEILVSGSFGEKPYVCNAVLPTDAKIIDNVKDILLGCKGFLPYSNGQYGLVVDKAESVSYAFTKDNILPGIQVKGVDKDSKFNQVVVSFANPYMDYQSDQVVYPEVGSADDITWLSEDDDERLKEEIDAVTITSRAAAYNLAKTILLRARNNIQVSFNSTSEALQLSVGDVITVTHDSLGWTNYPFKIENLTLNVDGTCSVGCREYTSAAYGFDTIANDPTFPESNLPDTFNPAAPTVLQASESGSIGADGALVPALTVSWVAALDAFVTGYELQWRKTTDTPYSSVNVTGFQYVLTGIAIGDNYDIRVRSINSFGSSSDWVSITSGLLAGDQTAPGLPTSIAATAGPKSIVLTWTNPSDSDFSNTKIYRSGTVDGTYEAIASIGGGFGLVASYNDGALSDSSAYFYKLSSVDYSGNESAQSSIVTATTDAPAASPRVTSGYVYYELSSANAPATPSATSYDFATGALSGLTANWDQDPITIDGSDAKYWATSYVVAETTFGGSQNITFSAPFTSYNFDGLVTFTNLNDELANASSTEITTINGGLLKTGTIDVGLVNITGTAGASGLDVKSAATGQRMEISSSVIKVYDSNGTLRIQLGNLGA